MRILIDNSGYDLKNMGDVAMLQIAVERFHELLPGWQIDVITQSPDLLARYCPRTNVAEVDLMGRRAFHSWKILGRLHASSVSPVRTSAVAIERWLRSGPPSATARRLALRFAHSGFPREAVRKFAAQMEKVDAIAASGGGFVTDAFSEHAQNVLDLMATGQARGIPTAMFGQGLGPIEEPALLNAARTIGNVDLVALREGRTGPKLLDKLGLPHSKLRVTGDDAIESAYRCRPEELGGCLGVNLRLSSYSGVLPDTARSVFVLLNEIALQVRTTVVPVPISFYDGESDVDRVLEFADVSEHEAAVAKAIETPDAVARQAGRCRVVVTGSYHAGVFALSQGISVVGVAATSYYADKFYGLQEQFPDGCATVTLNRSGALEQLRQTVMERWDEAPQARDKLLASASSQIAASRSAYQEWCRSILERMANAAA